MPLDAKELDEFKRLLAASKQKAFPFALCLGKKGPEDTAFLISKVLKADKLLLQARAYKGVDPAKRASGMVTSTGALVTLDCLDKPPSQCAKKVREYLKSLGYNLKVELKLNGEDVADEEEGSEGSDEEAPGEAATASPESPVEAQEEAPRGPREDPVATAKIAEELKALLQPVREAAGILPARADEANALLAEVSKASDARDYDLARVDLTKLDMLVAEAARLKAQVSEHAAELGKRVLEALKAGRGPVDALRKLWPYVEDLVTAGKIPQAQTAMAKVEEALAKTGGDAKPEAAGEVKEGTVSDAACARLLADIESKAARYDRAAKLLPGDAKMIAALNAAARKAAKESNLKGVETARGELEKLLVKAAGVERKLTEAQKGATDLAADIETLRGKYEALIAKPLPEALEKLVSVAVETLPGGDLVDPDAVTGAVAKARAALGAADKAGTSLAADKAAWEAARGPIGTLMKALGIHPQAAVMAVKAKIDAAAGKLAEADVKAATHDYAGALKALLPAVQAAHDEALQAADESARFAALVADRESRVGALPDSATQQLLNDALVALKKKLADAKKLVEGNQPDYPGATKLLDELGRDIPAVEVMQLNAKDYDKQLDWVTKELAGQKRIWGTVDPATFGMPSIKSLLLPEAEKLLAGADIAKTGDYRKSMDQLGRAQRSLGEAAIQVNAVLELQGETKKAKEKIKALGNHLGKKGVKAELDRLAADQQAINDAATDFTYAAGIRIAKAAQTYCDEATKKADLYLEYLTELKKSDGIEGIDIGTLDTTIQAEAKEAAEWRQEAKNRAAAGKVADAKDAAIRAAAMYDGAVAQINANKSGKELRKEGAGMSGAGDTGYAKALSAYTLELGKVEGSPGKDNKVVADNLVEVRKSAASAATAAALTPTPDWATAKSELKDAIDGLAVAIADLATVDRVNARLGALKSFIDGIEDVDGQFTDKIQKLKDAHKDAADELADGYFDDAVASCETAHVKAETVKKRTAAYKEFLAYNTSDVKPIHDKLNVAKAKAAIAPEVPDFLKAVKDARDRARTDEEREALVDLKKAKKTGDTLDKSYDQFLAAKKKEADLNIWHWHTEALKLRGAYPDMLAGVDKIKDAIDKAYADHVFTQAERLISDLNLATYHVNERGRKAAGFGTAEGLAVTAIGTAEAVRCPVVEPGLDRLKKDLDDARKAAADQIWPDAEKLVNAIPASAALLATKGTDFLAYDPEGKKAVAALEALEKDLGKQAAVAAQVRILTEDRSKMEALVRANDYQKAKAAAEALTAACGKVRADAAGQMAADDLAKGMDAKGDSADGFAEDLEKVKAEAAKLDAHAAKDAIRDARTQIAAALGLAARFSGEGKTPEARKALAAAAKLVAAAKGQADTARTALDLAKAIADRAKPLIAAVKDPAQLAAMLAEIDGTAAKAATLAGSGDGTGAVALLAPLGGKLDLAEEHRKGHDAYVVERDRLSPLIEPLEKHPQRYAITRDLKEIYAFLQEAAKRDLSLEYKLAAEAQKNCDKAISVATLAADMAGNVEVTPDKVDAVLKLPGGAKELDRLMKNLDPAAKRKVCKIALEKRFGFDLEQFEDTEGATPDTDKDKRAVNITRLYDVMSRLPDSHSTKNPSLKKVQDFGDKKPTTGDVSTSSSFNGGTKLVKLRVGRGDIDKSEKIGLKSELGEVDADSAPVDVDKPPSTFSWTTLHEIGHALDDKLGFMDKRAKDADMGGWEEYGANVTPIAEKAAVKFKYDAKYIAAYLAKAAMDPPPPSQGCDPDTEAGISEWEARRLAAETWCDAIRHDKDVYYSASTCENVKIGDRIYQESYSGTWLSYLAAARKKGISGYQFRAPGEWFAELYAAYHSNKLNPSHPARKWLETL